MRNKNNDILVFEFEVKKKKKNENSLIGLIKMLL